MSQRTTADCWKHCSLFRCQCSGLPVQATPKWLILTRSYWDYSSFSTEELIFIDSKLTRACFNTWQVIDSTNRNLEFCVTPIHPPNQWRLCLIIWYDAVTSLSANGSTAFKWKLCCHWMTSLFQPLYSMTHHGSGFQLVIFHDISYMYSDTSPCVSYCLWLVRWGQLTIG